MKDIEKIKSEDLGCQVADANPGNFAIEQEVAAMVGATVPAPTEPSADDARELGAQLLVFLRRALTPIQTALRTAVADIYAHLDSRCTDYTPAAYASYIPRPYDPMGSTPRTLPNLLTALTAFSARKISNGSAPSDGIPDGTSLAHLLCSADAANAVTEIADDNTGWTLNSSKLKALLGLLPNVETVTANGIGQLAQQTIQGNAELKTLNLTGVTSADSPYSNGDSDAMRSCIMQNPKLEEVYAPSLTDYTCGGNGNQYNALISGCHALKKVTLGKVANNNYPGWGGTKWVIQYCEALEELHVAGVVETNCLVRSGQNANLILLEFTAEQTNSANLAWWNPTNVLADADKTATFLQNFREHIALRLTANGTGKTLTLSQAVFDTIWNADGTPKSTDPDSVIYQINKIIKTDKHWSVNRA